jgi:hypothetical protein
MEHFIIANDRSTYITDPHNLVPKLYLGHIVFFQQSRCASRGSFGLCSPSRGLVMEGRPLFGSGLCSPARWDTAVSR